MLVDGGVALPLPRGIAPADLLAGVLGPALARLEMTFTDHAAYHDYWRAHPALADPGAWTDTTEAWLDHDLTGTEPVLRSSASLEAVHVDGTELLVDHDVRRAFNELTHDIHGLLMVIRMHKFQKRTRHQIGIRMTQ